MDPEHESVTRKKEDDSPGKNLVFDGTPKSKGMSASKSINSPNLSKIEPPKESPAKK